jgi:cell wall-associated NlpC family hydrolase
MHRPTRRLRFALAASLLALAGCASLPAGPASQAMPLPEAGAAQVEALPEPAPTASALPDPGSGIAMRALSQLGVRYRFGGNSPETGFDCSGFVRWVFRDHDTLALPRASQDMARFDAPSVDPAALAPGDLVFFRIRGNRVSHVGIYIGDGRFVHAPSRGGMVRVDHLDDRYWKRRWAGAKRVLARG